MKTISILVLALCISGTLAYYKVFSRYVGRQETEKKMVVSNTPGHVKPLPETKTEDPGGSLFFIEDLKQALKEDNAEDIRDALDKLTQSFKEHPGNQGELFSALNNEDNFSQVIARLLEISSTQPNRAGARLLTGLAADLALHDPLPERRQAGLVALSKVPEPSPDLLQNVVRSSREDQSNEVRLSAIATLAVWMHRQPDLVEKVTSELLQTIHLSTNNQVRASAIQTIVAQKRALTEKVVEVINEFLIKEPGTQNRLLVARAVGGETPQARSFSLGQLQQAYQQETDIKVKQNVLTEIVRIGQSDAMDILEKIPSDNPLLAQDTKEYLEILQAGVTDPNKVFSEKSQRDAARMAPAHTNAAH
ncbi:MAG: hypothetical protein M3Y82_05350 [Verrucomicrobiota bacterium]|nr:hypothetical protein [Verrucomicrobiota bacterium]